MTNVAGLNSASPAPTSTKNNTLGQEQFLTLLVAQMQNQNPLNPADATEFTAQLAQYSQLEQLFNLNSTMDKLAEAQNNSERLSALSLIGKEVVVEGSSFSFDGNEARVGYKVDGIASEITLQIRNGLGQTVATINATDTDKGNHFLSWNGRDSAGNQLEAGTYSIVINAKSAGDGSSVAVAPLVRAEVTGVDLSGTEPLIVTVAGEYRIPAIHGAYDKGEHEAATIADRQQQPPPTASVQDPAAASSTLEEFISAATDGAGIIEENWTELPAD
ncbi:flagellar hook assembly protein FlgD [Desulfobulbus alkaliphilus]|nr:flagellar hook assembly protein FlgD [Desulfobulbus alkaliphilus]